MPRKHNVFSKPDRSERQCQATLSAWTNKGMGQQNLACGIGRQTEKPPAEKLKP